MPYKVVIPTLVQVPLSRSEEWGRSVPTPVRCHAVGGGSTPVLSGASSRTETTEGFS